jgi:antirestriction protein ArdC
MESRQTTNEKIVNRLLESMEKTEQLPWHAGWISGGLPVNFTTGKRYNGINILMLWSGGFTHSKFATYKQIEAKGGQVRKGEKGTPVIYYNVTEKIGKDAGSDEEKIKRIPFAKLSYAFNISQTEGIMEDAVETGDHETAEEFIRAIPATIVHGYDPCYVPKSDEIRIPLRSDIETEERYYSVLFHELVHWSGAAGRMNREMVFQNRDIDKYSFEELVAEIGSAFLLAEFGIKPCEEQNAAYVKGWAERIGSDKSMVVKAASQASKAVEYLLNLKQVYGLQECERSVAST